MVIEFDPFVRRLVDGLDRDMRMWKYSRNVLQTTDFKRHKTALRRMDETGERMRALVIRLVLAEIGATPEQVETITRQLKGEDDDETTS